MEKEDTIPNWTYFGSRMAFIDLHRFDDTDPENDFPYIYNATVTFHLDDGEEESEKVITISTDYWLPCASCLATDIAERFSALFDNIHATVSIYDEDGKEVDTIDLNDEEDVEKHHLEKHDADDLELLNMPAGVPLIH